MKEEQEREDETQDSNRERRVDVRNDKARQSRDPVEGPRLSFQTKQRLQSNRKRMSWPTSKVVEKGSGIS